MSFTAHRDGASVISKIFDWKIVGSLLRHFFCFSIAVLLGGVLFPYAVHAQITYDATNHAYFVTSDATINTDITANDVFVGKNNATDFNTFTGPVTLTVTDGADTNWYGNTYPIGATGPKFYTGINVFGDNSVHIAGGSVRELGGYDNSATTITGGNLDSFYFMNNSNVTINDGLISNIYMYDRSACTINGGELFRGVAGTDNSHILITGGTVFGIVSSGNSIIDITGGAVTYTDNYGGNINISGGTVAVGRGDGLGSGVTTISGGEVTQFLARD
jgi:hypothetical protein